MNILIKLTCLIGLVVAPILGNGHSGDNAGHGATGDSCKAKTECASHHGKDNKACHGDKKACDTKAECKKGGCDMSKCSEMTKDECAAMCDANGCSPEQKAKCLAMYDENGKFIGEKMCCEGKAKTGKCDTTCKH